MPAPVSVSGSTSFNSFLVASLLYLVEQVVAVLYAFNSFLVASYVTYYDASKTYRLNLQFFLSCIEPVPEITSDIIDIAFNSFLVASRHELMFISYMLFERHLQFFLSCINVKRDLCWRYVYILQFFLSCIRNFLLMGVYMFNAFSCKKSAKLP